VRKTEICDEVLRNPDGSVGLRRTFEAAWRRAKEQIVIGREAPTFAMIRSRRRGDACP
jgi:hypothetical protein